MRYLKVVFIIGCLALMGVFLPSKTKADDFYNRTSITFDEPVELPGIVLPAGTYVFKSENATLPDHVVKIYNADETKLITMILSIPSYRTETTELPEFTFEKRAAGTPQAIKVWYYPGRSYGEEFVYPKLNANELATLNPQQVPSMPTEIETAATNPAPSPEEEAMLAASSQPSEKEEPLVETIQPNPPEQTQASMPEAAQMAATTQTEIPTHLPRTASPLYSIGLAGLLLLAGALMLQFLSKQMV
jgi:hypothetical protein